jgi:dynein heavy chain
MNLILFEFAIDHMLRICRILKMSRSHALLVGLGGRGRQSLTRLSAFICDHEVFTVEVSKSYNFEQWRNDLQRLIISAGTENKYYVFLMTDSQLKETYILEDINNLLNSADVPNLLSPDEFVPLIDKLRIKAKQEDREDLYSFGTNAQYYDYFIENVRAHLHVVLVLSSIGTSMRTKIRMFPSLVNCCTLIWYKPWPEEALQAVA